MHPFHSPSVSSGSSTHSSGIEESNPLLLLSHRVWLPRDDMADARRVLLRTAKLNMVATNLVLPVQKGKKEKIMIEFF